MSSLIDLKLMPFEWSDLMQVFLIQAKWIIVLCERTLNEGTEISQVALKICDTRLRKIPVIMILIVFLQTFYRSHWFD